jgi:hypothetical protein
MKTGAVKPVRGSEPEAAPEPLSWWLYSLCASLRWFAPVCAGRASRLAQPRYPIPTPARVFISRG